MSEPSIVLYDIPSTLPIPWSPNTWRTRYVLNYKGIPYKTVWVEYPDIEAVCKDLGAAPTSKKADGQPLYTLPVIRDLTNGLVISNSPDIAAYLDKQYPNTPQVLPAGTEALQYAFTSAYGALIEPMFQFSVPQTNRILRPRSEAFFRETRERSEGVRMEDMAPVGDKRTEEWAKYEKGLGKIDEWLKKSGGPFLMGDTITFADVTLVSYLIYVKVIWGEESMEWKGVKTWHGGRWEGLVNAFSPYAQAH